MKFFSTALLFFMASSQTEAFSVGGSMVSAFGGKVLLTAAPTSSGTYGSGASIEMKKGKSNVPITMRAQYERSKEMAKMREEMEANQRPGADGLPVFNLFVRTKRANVSESRSNLLLQSHLNVYIILNNQSFFHQNSHDFIWFQLWYPCGSFKGDERSGALCASYRDGGFLSGTSKNQLDAGVAGSLYRDQAQLKETICRAYPQLRKSKDELEFGYKLAYEGLDEEKSKIQPIEPKEQKGWVDGIKASLGL